MLIFVQSSGFQCTFPLFNNKYEVFWSTYAVVKEHICVCVSVTEPTGVTKVTEWHTFYGTDSGIQSGANTVRSDDDGTEYSKKLTYSATYTENPAGEIQSHPTTRLITVCLDCLNTNP